MNIDIFKEYKKINLDIIKSIKEDEEDLTLFERREEILKKILSLNVDKSEIKRIYLEEKLDVLDKELEDIIKDKMISIKSEIKGIAIKKQANLGYVNVNRSSNLFSKRV